LLLERTEVVCGMHGREQIVPECFFLPAYIFYIMEPPAGGRPRSVAHGSVRNELVGRLCMIQLVREVVETSTVTVCPRSAVRLEESEDRFKQQ